eukprot:gene1423-biopygen8267
MVSTPNALYVHTAPRAIVPPMSGSAAPTSILAMIRSCPCSPCVDDCKGFVAQFGGTNCSSVAAGAPPLPPLCDADMSMQLSLPPGQVFGWHLCPAACNKCTDWIAPFCGQTPVAPASGNTSISPKPTASPVIAPSAHPYTPGAPSTSPFAAPTVAPGAAGSPSLGPVISAPDVPPIDEPSQAPSWTPLVYGCEVSAADRGRGLRCRDAAPKCTFYGMSSSW